MCSQHSAVPFLLEKYFSIKVVFQCYVIKFFSLAQITQQIWLKKQNFNILILTGFTISIAELMMKRWSLHSWTLVASSGKLRMDRTTWCFSNNHCFHEEALKRWSNHSSFSLGKTSHPSPSSSALSLGVHNATQNLSGWTVKVSLVLHSFSWSYLQFLLTTLQCICLTSCYRQARELTMHIINICIALCGNGDCETSAWFSVLRLEVFCYW